MISTGVMSGAAGCSAWTLALGLAVDLDEQLLERAEVVGEGGVGDAHLLGDRAEARPVGTASREDLDRTVEDLLAPGDALGVRAPCTSGRRRFGGHASILFDKNLHAEVSTATL